MKCAVFDGQQIIEIVTLEDDGIYATRKIIEKYSPSKSILSSVIDHDPQIEELLTSQTRFHKLTNTSILPFTSPVGKPETIGADRLALSAAAVHFYPGRNNLVIGLGSCITYNFINKYSQFMGGSISPGMEMRFRSLSAFTAKLPLVKADWNFPLIGYDTRTNITSGVIFGMIAEIDGVIDAYNQRFSNFNALLTGGDSPYFARHLKNRIFADPEMIFKGLFAISECNDDKN